MAHDPDQRPGSAGELVLELERGLADLTTRRPPASPRGAWTAAGDAAARSRPVGWVSGAAATAASARERRSPPPVEARSPAAAPVAIKQHQRRRLVGATVSLALLAGAATGLALSADRPRDSTSGAGAGTAAPAPAPRAVDARRTRLSLAAEGLSVVSQHRFDARVDPLRARGDGQPERRRRHGRVADARDPPGPRRPLLGHRGARV